MLWIDCPGYPGYKISPYGEVLSVKNPDKPILIKQEDFIYEKPDRFGNYYKRFTPVKNGKIKHVRIHRLIAEVFCKKPININKSKLVVHHKDGNRANNNYLNLEWTTIEKNSNIGFSDHEGKMRNHLDKVRPNVKLNKQKILEIKKLLKNGITQTKIGKLFNVQQNTISRIKTGKRWKWV